jgi:hypothetical protein
MKNINLKTMKTKFLNLILSLFVAMAVVSCVEDDYGIPNSLGNEENAALSELLMQLEDENSGVVEVSIQDVKNLYNGQATLIESDIVVKGYVSSSDQTGNFYKEFYMQDTIVNPSYGIPVMLNQVDSYNQFNKGREVYIKLKGLYVSENSQRIITIGGGVDDEDLVEISSNRISEVVLRSPNSYTIIPDTLRVSEVNSGHVGQFITLENVQFLSSLMGKTYVDPYDDFDTQRALKDCDDDSQFDVETSSFANFAQLPLPMSGRGTISGVVTQRYNSNALVLYLNTPEDINFDQERCDPVFEETFSAAVDGSVLDLDGWINYAEAGTAMWMEDVYGGNGYARFSAYNSGDSSNIGWLITPGIDLDAQDGEILTFETEHAYPDSGHEPLEVFISTDFDGTETGIATATWQPLTFDVSYIVDYGSWFNFTPSGEIDISSYSGTAYIAFKYTGSDTSNQNMTLDIDNVRVAVP